MQPWLQARIRKRAAGALGGAWGLHLGVREGGGQDTKGLVRRQLCTRQSSVWQNSLYKGSDILLAPQHNAAIAKATAADQVGSAALIPRLSGAL